MRRALYAWAVIPTVAISAESAVTGGFDFSSVLMQGGIGGLAAMVAVKMLLVLYNDKERDSNLYHTKLLAVIESQIAVNKDLIASNLALIKEMDHVRELVLENRAIFRKHVLKEVEI